jgi:CubicO group peptidase (beta-lactamase class C family)
LVYYQALGYKTVETKDTCNLKTLFEAASMTKTMFAYLVLKLAQESIINLDKPLYQYLPNPDLSADKRYKQITARMVLSHTSGLPNWRTNQLKIEAPPGTKYIYSGEGYEYLGRVIEHILQKELNEVYLEKVIRPLGLKNSFFVESGYLNHYMANGYQNGKLSGRDISFEGHTAYGLRTNAFDYSKFISHLTRDEMFSLMTASQTKTGSNKYVGLGIFKEVTENGTKYYHTGNNSARFTGRFEIYPDQQFASIVLMNCGKEKEFSKALNKFLTRWEYFYHQKGRIMIKVY